MGVDDERARGEKTRQQRAGNVVRKIADPARNARRIDKAAPIDAQNIAFDNAQIFRLAAAQDIRARAVDFDGDNARARRQQRKSQRAVAGANLDHDIARARRDGFDHRVDDRRVAQKMLAEALSNRRRGGGRNQLIRAAACSAAVIAAKKLRVSSLPPPPAKSKATPWSGETRKNGNPRVALIAAKSANLTTGKA